MCAVNVYMMITNGSVDIRKHVIRWNHPDVDIRRGGRAGGVLPELACGRE